MIEPRGAQAPPYLAEREVSESRRRLRTRLQEFRALVEAFREADPAR
jgi:hypothetical protein